MLDHSLLQTRLFSRLSIGVATGALLAVNSIALAQTAATPPTVPDTGSSRAGIQSRAAQVPDTAGVPLSLKMTGAKPPSPEELAREARRLRALNRQRGIKALNLSPRTELPKQFESPYVTPPARLQGNNDCWAFGTVAVMESAFLKAARSHDTSLHFAPQAVVDCNPYKDNSPKDGGWWSFVVYAKGEDGKGKGGPIAANYPYVGSDERQPCKIFIPPRPE